LNTYYFLTDLSYRVKLYKELTGGLYIPKAITNLIENLYLDNLISLHTKKVEQIVLFLADLDLKYSSALYQLYEGIILIL